MLPGLEKTTFWVSLLQQTMLLIGEPKANGMETFNLPIGISFVNGGMVITMYGVRVLVGVRTFTKQIVIVGDGFGSNCTVILSWLTFLCLLVSQDIHQYP
jgi:hypothetical protein